MDSKTQQKYNFRILYWFSQKWCPDSNQHEHNNLTPAEKGVLQELKERDDIVIKSADKGSTFVVMDKVDYLEEATLGLSGFK
jgi:hypothetical protein